METTTAGMRRRVIRVLDERERALIGPELQAIADAQAREAVARDTIGRMLQLITGWTDVVLSAATGEIYVVEQRPEMTAAGVSPAALVEPPEEVEVPDAVLDRAT